jgi:hypothetical protein
MQSGEHVISRDGTPITFEVQGRGPALILVAGGLDDGSENAPLARELSQRFEVFNYARRGRAPSGDTLPYAVAREIEDIEALMERAGGHATCMASRRGRRSCWRRRWPAYPPIGSPFTRCPSTSRRRQPLGSASTSQSSRTCWRGGARRGARAVHAARGFPRGDDRRGSPLSALAAARGVGAHARLRRCLPGRPSAASRTPRAHPAADAGRDGRQ